MLSPRAEISQTSNVMYCYGVFCQRHNITTDRLVLRLTKRETQGGLFNAGLRDACADILHHVRTVNVCTSSDSNLK